MGTSQERFSAIFIVVFLLSFSVYAQMEVLEFQRTHKIKFEKIQAPRDLRNKALEDLYKGLTIEILVLFFSTNTEMWLFWTDDQFCIDIHSTELIETIRRKGKKPEDVAIVIHNHPLSLKRGALPGLTYNDVDFYKQLEKAGITNAKFQVWCEGLIFDNMDSPIQHWMPIKEFEKLKESLKSGES